MLNLLIIDDEAPARSRLRRMVARVADCEVLGEAASGEEALEQIANLKPDAILLDISMPGLSGMGLARRLREQQPAPLVIFCTAHPDQALEAFDCDAIDYLLKPVRQERLENALGKARRLAAEVVEVEEQEEVFLRSTVGGKTALISLDRVICLLAEDKYTTVFYEGGKTVINNPLIELEERHVDRLLRVHRNALVARNRIRGLERNRGGVVNLVLEGCDYRPAASRRRLPVIRRIIKGLE
jgi:two-component system response regulator AlgR